MGLLQVPAATAATRHVTRLIPARASPVMLHSLLLAVIASAVISCVALGAQGASRLPSTVVPSYTMRKYIIPPPRPPLSLNSTMTLNDGDVVTCLALKDQPSLVGHSYRPDIQASPSKEPQDDPPRTSTDPSIRMSHQTYLINGKICPTGTYPHRAPTNRTHTKFNDHLIDYEYSRAFLETEAQGAQGAQGNLNIWKPYVQYPSSFSSVDLWLDLSSNHSKNSSSKSYATVGASVKVSEMEFGDKNPRLVIYYFGANKTGCNNLDCSGFVQVSNKVLLGGTMEGISTTDGIQYEILLQIFQDPKTLNWWLQLNNEYVGYWPRHALISPVYDQPVQVDIVSWAGDVLSYPSDDQFTTTHMGSGAFPEAGFKKAAYMRNLQYINMGYGLEDATKVKLASSSSSCYGGSRQLGRGCGAAVSPVPVNEWGVYFFFGGPGRNQFCE